MNLLPLIKLLLAHILTDFIFQSNKWVKEKKKKTIKSKYFWLHIIIAAALSYLLVGEWSYWQIPLVILITHGLIDYVKLILSRKEILNSTTLFVLDQLAHLLVIMGIWLYYNNSLHLNILLLSPENNVIFWVILTATILLTTPTGILVGNIVEPFRKKIKTNDSLKNAGKYIGIAERLLIFIFILMNQYSAIGFLLASKSILRISKDSDKDARKKTEYVLVGTLVSYLFAIVISLLTKYLLNL